VTAHFELNDLRREVEAHGLCMLLRQLDHEMAPGRAGQPSG
jgi:hypothetical protein